MTTTRSEAYLARLDYEERMAREGVAKLVEKHGLEAVHIAVRELVAVASVVRRSPPEGSVAEQLIWIDEHGGDLDGYVERYGSKDDPGHYGNGGEAIFEADMEELHRRRRMAKARLMDSTP